MQERGPEGDRGTGKVAGKCVCVSWEVGGCLSMPSPHTETITSALRRAIGLQKVEREQQLG